MVSSTWVTTVLSASLPAHHRLSLLSSVMAHEWLRSSMAMYDSVIPGWNVDDNLVSTSGISVIAEKNNSTYIQTALASRIVASDQTNRDQLICIMNTSWLLWQYFMPERFPLPCSNLLLWSLFYALSIYYHANWGLQHTGHYELVAHDHIGPGHNKTILYFIRFRLYYIDEDIYEAMQWPQSNSAQSFQKEVRCPLVYRGCVVELRISQSMVVFNSP